MAAPECLWMPSSCKVGSRRSRFSTSSPRRLETPVEGTAVFSPCHAIWRRAVMSMVFWMPLSLLTMAAIPSSRTSVWLNSSIVVTLFSAELANDQIVEFELLLSFFEDLPRIRRYSWGVDARTSDFQNAHMVHGLIRHGEQTRKYPEPLNAHTEMPTHRMVQERWCVRHTHAQSLVRTWSAHQTALSPGFHQTLRP